MRSSRFLLAGAVAISSACSPRPAIHSGTADTSRLGDAARLPTGVHLDPAGVVYGVGSMPLNALVSPSGDRVVLALNGWTETGLQVVDWRSGRITQTVDLPAVFLGAAFSPDGRWLAISGGNTDQVYRFRWTGDSAVFADSIPLAPHPVPHRPGTRYPAQLAYSPDGSRLYVAENLADSLAVIDLASSRVIERKFAGRYPYGVAVSGNGTVYVSAWGGESVAAFDDRNGWLSEAEWIPAGRHPSAILLDRSGARLFIASASTDRVTVVDTRTRRRVAEFRDPPPAGPDEGATPNALALSNDETRLFVAEADANAVAVFDVARSDSALLVGRIPTGWYPSAMAVTPTTLLVANGKGSGTHADPDGPGPRQSLVNQGSGKNGTLGQLRGSLSVVPLASLDGQRLAELTARVVRANGWNDSTRIRVAMPPFTHVVYVIKENRTYDQVLGDLQSGDGDTSLVYFGRQVTPNIHALAERFGVFDRFFVNAEVSGDGHNWTTAAYASDYVEKTVQPNYSSRGRTYDYEGTNRGVVPDDDVNEPASGYLWTLAARRGVSLRNYGEFVVPERSLKRRGEDENGWTAQRYVGNKPQLKGTTNPEYPGFNLDIMDQKRADIWIGELQTYVQRGTMPALEIVRLPNDHTSGGAAGKPTPRAAVSDNDLALGRMIAALSRTPFWKSTVVFVLEDDAQNGPDHVDSHRSPMLVISAYNRPGTYHRFTNTTDVIRTVESVLQLDALSHFDFYGRPLTGIWSSTPDLRPYDVLTPSVNLEERNPTNTRGARDSRRLRFDREDESDDDDFSKILWHVVKGYDKPYPGPTRMGIGEVRRAR